MDSENIRVTMHSEKLKFGRLPDPKAPSLSDQVRDSSLVAEAGREHIESIGFELSYAQARALFAVQILLDRTDFNGNVKPVRPQQAGRYHFQGDLPVLEVKTPEFLDAYGVKKARLGRRFEYSRQARRVAVNALRDLSEDKYLLVYEKSASKRSRNQVFVEALGPLVSVTWLNKGRRLRTVPNPVLVDQIDSYYILKPENLFDLVPDKDLVKVRFLEWLLYHANHNRRDLISGKGSTIEVRMQSEVVAHQLRIAGLLKARKRKQLRAKLTALYEFGKRVGYLRSFKVDQPGKKKRKVDILKFKKSAFKYLVPVVAKSGTK